VHAASNASALFDASQSIRFEMCMQPRSSALTREFDGPRLAPGLSDATLARLPHVQLRVDVLQALQVGLLMHLLMLFFGIR
jgi:hypothetical protein